MSWRRRLLRILADHRATEVDRGYRLLGESDSVRLRLDLQAVLKSAAEQVCRHGLILE